MMYFLITSGEDGTRVRPLTHSEMQKILAEVAAGDRTYTFLDKIPPDDKGYWEADEHAAVIIKGEIVVPKATIVVKAYELP